MRAWRKSWKIFLIKLRHQIYRALFVYVDFISVGLIAVEIILFQTN